MRGDSNHRSRVRESGRCQISSDQTRVATSPADVHATGQIGAENRPSLGERQSNSGMRASAVIPCPNRQKSITGSDTNGVASRTYLRVPVKPRSGEPTGSRFLCAEHGPDQTSCSDWRPAAHHRVNGGNQCRRKRGRRSPAEARQMPCRSHSSPRRSCPRWSARAHFRCSARYAYVCNVRRKRRNCPAGTDPTLCRWPAG